MKSMLCNLGLFDCTLYNVPFFADEFIGYLLRPSHDLQLSQQRRFLQYLDDEQ